MVKYLSIIFLLLLAGCVAANQTLQQHSDSVEIRLTYNQDTIHFGDTLQICVTFSNQLNDSVTIFPRARVMLNHSDLGYINDIEMLSTLYLNYAISDKPSIIMAANSATVIKYSVIVQNVFFRKGENFLYIVYACRLPRNKLIINPITYAISKDEIVFVK